MGRGWKTPSPQRQSSGPTRRALLGVAQLLVVPAVAVQQPVLARSAEDSEPNKSDSPHVRRFYELARF